MNNKWASDLHSHEFKMQVEETAAEKAWDDAGEVLADVQRAYPVCGIDGYYDTATDTFVDTTGPNYQELRNARAALWDAWFVWQKARAAAHRAGLARAASEDRPRDQKVVHKLQLVPKA